MCCLSPTGCRVWLVFHVKHRTREHSRFRWRSSEDEGGEGLLEVVEGSRRGTVEKEKVGMITSHDFIICWGNVGNAQRFT